MKKRNKPSIEASGRDSRPEDADAVEIRGVDFNSYAGTLAPLRFPPPTILGGMQSPSAIFAWRLLQFTFDIDAPDAVEPFRVTVPDDDARIIRRYYRKACDLATTTALTGEWALSVKEDPQKGLQVDTRTPSVEAMHAWASLFRLFWGQGEQASYEQVKGLLFKHADKQVDAGWSQRLDGLRRWDRAIHRLHEKSLRQLVHEQLCTVQGWAVPDRSLDPCPPAKTISEYLYGEYLHWDESHRDILEQREASPFDDAWYRFQFLEATVALGEMYIGFAEVAQRLIGR